MLFPIPFYQMLIFSVLPRVSWIHRSLPDSSLYTGLSSLYGWTFQTKVAVYSYLLPFRKLDCPVVRDDIQCIVSELNLRNQKWLILSVYRNPKQNIKYFLDQIINILDFFASSFENNIVMGDFNAEVTQPDMLDFMSNYSLSNLIKHPTCYKSSEGRCI